MVENSIILSIKPEHANKIFSGNKMFEFRRKIWKDDPPIQRIYLYSSAPVKKIVGYFTIKRIFKGTPKNLWEYCEKKSGLHGYEFLEYFNEAEEGFAIQIDEVFKYHDPLNPLDPDPEFKAPQNFMYLKSLNEHLQAAIIKSFCIELLQSSIDRLQEMAEKRYKGGFFKKNG